MFTVCNLGRNGADTKEELEILQNYPVRPDLLLLCHLPNDIEKVQPPPPSTTSPQIQKGSIKFLKFLSRGSFVLNYGFWKFNGFVEGFEKNEVRTNAEQFGNDYIRWHFRESSRQEHRADLKAIVDLCRENGTQLLVLTFPELYDEAIDFTHQQISLPLESWFSGFKVPVVHAYDVLRPLPESDRIVNQNDMHPSVAAHRAVADLILRRLDELGWLPASP
jgi:hypothetical protein